MSELAVGIDLGTSNSCVAIMRGGKTVEVLSNAYGESTSASVVAFAEDGMITVGNAAKANVIHEPQHTVSSAKRLIGRYFFSEEVKKAQAIFAYEIAEAPSHGVAIKIRDETFSLPEISAMVLREMKHIAEERLGEPVTKAVITVPAYFNDNQRQATKDAGRIAGLEVLRILNEPTAAALAYGFGRGLNQRVAVYDLGGGTFDISVLEIGKDVFEVLSTCGDTFLGGDDFDDRIIDMVADEFLQQNQLNLRDDLYAFEKLKVAAEAAKMGLSEEEEVEIRIPDILTRDDGSSLSIARTLSRQEFSGLVHDLVQRTFKVCDEALQQADLTVRDLDGVILVGGPTRLPIIRDAVQAYFQQPSPEDVDPDEVVAMGAAIHAASLVNQDQDSYLLDVTPLDLRIGLAGGLAEPVIERNTPVPIEQTRRFTTFQDYQESVNVRIYQGGERQAEDNELLGQFEFSGFEKKRRGEVAIDVTFEINADGIVEVTACEPESGQRASTTITLASSLSESEMETIIENDRTARVASSAPEASDGRAELEVVEEPVAAAAGAAVAEASAATPAETPPAAPEVPAPVAEEPVVAVEEPVVAAAAEEPVVAEAAEEPETELGLSQDDELDMLEVDDDLDLEDGELETLAGEAELELHDVQEEPRTDAITAPEMGGAPDDQVPLANDALEAQEPHGNAKTELFDADNHNLSGDSDEFLE